MSYGLSAVSRMVAAPWVETRGSYQLFTDGSRTMRRTRFAWASPLATRGDREGRRYGFES
jgi:hypothetical protein